MNVREETWKHRHRVCELMIMASKELMDRGLRHDASKCQSPEVELFDQYTPMLAGLPYPSEEYDASKKLLGPALDHHYAVNSHHTEHYENGINDMDLFDLTEMLLDWKAAGERQNNGNILVSLEANRKKYNISDQLYSILKHTVHRYLR